MLSLKNITVTIGETEILHGISCEIARGDVVGLIGPNGSGKSTLFNTLSGFLPLTSGEIELNGMNISSISGAERARHGLGRVFQNPGLFPDLTLEENLLVALEHSYSLLESVLFFRGKTKQSKKRALELLGEIGLAERAHHKAGSLSGGQKRLLEIIRTVAFDASVLLFDEPTAGVSPKMKREVSALIQRLSSEGRTVWVIEHDLNFIQEFCSRVIVLDQGNIVLDGPPAEVRASPLLREIYLG